MWFLIRVVKGWKISGKFPETFQKSQEVSKISGNFLEIVYIFATLFVIIISFNLKYLFYFANFEWDTNVTGVWRHIFYLL